MKTFLVCDDSESTLCDFEEVAESHNSGKMIGFASKDEMLGFMSNPANDIGDAVFFLDLQLKAEPDAGFEILKLIRSSEKLSNLPVVIVTTASEQKTINESYELGANAFVRKSDAPEEFRNDIAAMYNFWGGTSLHKDENVDSPPDVAA